MEISYWKSRWRKNNTGWHMTEVYPMLPELWPKLALRDNATVLVPLCGKSRDMQWLAAQGFHIIGVEASSKALEQFMQSSDRQFSRTHSHGYTVFTSTDINLWQGNFLNLPQRAIGPVNAIYDKASIVALPPEMRKEYSRKLLNLCNDTTEIFLQSFEYEQKEMNGPPFSVDENEIRSHFDQRFNITLMNERSIFENVKKFQQRGLSSYFIEKIYHLSPR